MRNKQIDQLAEEITLKKNKDKAYRKILDLAKERGIKLASINDLYAARAKQKVGLDFTVPALNLRGMTYDMAQAVFQVAKTKRAGALIFEIARSEMGYTNQPPKEYAGVIMAAALKEGVKGPLFIQGDHFQVKCSDQPGVAKESEEEKIKQLIKQSIEAGFYNIDLDISTLVDYSKKEIIEQQRNNFEMAAKLTKYVRDLEAGGITISLGGEIGHIGGKNSTEEELRAYMKGYNQVLPKGMIGLSKMAIQTGTHHGGVPLPDGTLADVDVDFSCLKRLSQVAREYGMGGTVQHGASTLPDKFFNQFVKAEAVEVHLATGFQNIIMDHAKFPKNLLKKMYQWMKKELGEERKEEWSKEQFYYKLRKKAWGAFKKDLWELSESVKKPIREALRKRFSSMFKELGVENSAAMVEKFIKNN